MALARAAGALYDRLEVAEDQLQLELRHENGRAIVRLQGELDLATAPLLEKAIEGIDPDSSIVVLDLQGLNFIDSTGLRTFLAAKERVCERGGELAVTRGSPQVQRLLALTRADEHLHVITSPDAALI
jgi:anti-sigma B factor antagonist